MRFGYTGGTTIRLVWALALLGATSYMATALALGMTPQEYPGLGLPHTTLEQAGQALGLIAIWLVFGAPFFTAHEVQARDVVLRQGILFHARIAFEDVEEVNYGAGRPVGVGVRWYPDVLFVVTWPANLVEIRLKRRRMFRLLGIIPLPPVSRIAVNVDDPTGLLTALREAMALATGTATTARG